MNTEEITKYIFLDDAQDPAADIAMVFGTWSAHQESVEKAAHLYKRGLVRKIITTGGANENVDYIEGEEMAKELKGMGVSTKNILIENRAMNTLENVLFSRDILDREEELEHVRSIVAVVKNFHARRVLMTLKKNMPAHIHFKVAPYVSRYADFTKKNWQESCIGREKVQQEIEKIERYLKKGDIAQL